MSHATTSISLLMVIGSICASGGPTPQDPASQIQNSGGPADPRLVVVHANVTDQSGVFVANLPQSAFKLFENGVEQPLRMFRIEETPISMGLVIDNSASMRDYRAAVVTAAKDLVNTSSAQDETFLVNFNDDTYLDQAFTSDTKKLETAIDRIDPHGGTAMRDALGLSIDYVKQKAMRDRKILLLVTDGEDNTSNLDLESLVRKARASDILIYCIGLLGDEEPRYAEAAKHALRALSEVSGGSDYYPTDLADLSRIIPLVGRDIRSQYVLGYLPTNGAADAASRQITIRVTGPGPVTVRTQTGSSAPTGGSGITFR